MLKGPRYNKDYKHDQQTGKYKMLLGHKVCSEQWFLLCVRITYAAVHFAKNLKTVSMGIPNFSNVKTYYWYAARTENH